MVRRREEWVASLDDHDAERLVFLDETGFQESIHNNRGWAPSGETPTVIAPYRGRNTTAIGAIRLSGPCALCAMDGYMNKDDLLWFLEEVLGPELHDGDIVVMDNLRAHTSIEAAELLACFGATPLFLPPYSPEYNPIEFCWGVMKSWFRKLPPVKGIEAVLERVVALWDQLDAGICERTVKHCGYAARAAST